MKLPNWAEKLLIILRINKMAKIRNLEKKYMQLIWEWVSSDEFSNDLLEIEEYIKANYKDLSQKYQIKNKLQKAEHPVMSCLRKESKL